MIERAPKWALCSDCLWMGYQTCPEKPQCWSPMKTEDLHDSRESFQAAIRHTYGELTIEEEPDIRDA